MVYFQLLEDKLSISTLKFILVVSITFTQSYSLSALLSVLDIFIQPAQKLIFQIQLFNLI